jgi:hypothetical protein
MKQFLLALLLLSGPPALSQATQWGDFKVTGSQSIGTTASPNSKSVLDLVSTTKGLLTPRMTSTQRNAIVSPPTALEIFNSTTSHKNYYDGSNWQELSSNGLASDWTSSNSASIDGDTYSAIQCNPSTEAKAYVGIADVTNTSSTPKPIYFSGGSVNNVSSTHTPSAAHLVGGNAEGSGDGGDVDINAGYAANGGTGGFLQLFSGNANGGNANGGNILIQTGHGFGSGHAGNIYLNPGATTGKIAFENANEGTSGQAWVSTDTNGSGHWGTLSTSGFPSIGTAGTYLQVVTDSTGRVTSGNNTLSAANFWVGSGSNIATGVTMGGDATMSSSGNLVLAASGTAGAYYKVNTDSKGRITSGNSSLSTADFPSLSSANFWVGNGSNIATGVTMGGDATMSNSGNLVFKSVGTAGSYQNVVTDAQGRVTSGNNTLSAANLWVGNSSNIAAAVTMGGDATMSSSGSLVFSSIGTAGTYAQVVTDAKGRVTSGTATLPVNAGGTGQTSYTDGQLLIGNTTGNTLAKATLTAGSNITITNGAGSISIAASSSATPKYTYVSQSSTLNPAVLGNWYRLSGATFTVTLPDATAALAAGQDIIFEHDGTSLTQVYCFATTSGQTITGPGGAVASGNYCMYTNGERLRLGDDGSGWQVLEHKTESSEADAGALAVSSSSHYVFTLASSATIAGGTVYTANGNTFYVSAASSASTTLNCFGTGSPGASGTLTFVSGTAGNRTFNSVVTTAPVKGTATYETFIWRRQGKYVHWKWDAKWGAGTAGSGEYGYFYPAGLVPDSTNIQQNVALNSTFTLTNAFSRAGYLILSSSTPLNINLFFGNPAFFKGNAIGTGSWSSSVGGNLSVAQSLSATGSHAVTGWQP